MVQSSIFRESVHIWEEEIHSNDSIAKYLLELENKLSNLSTEIYEVELNEKMWIYFIRASKKLLMIPFGKRGSKAKNKE